jgi:ubiquinone/menaquinone biosynthesis C-methylase UbiE
MFICGFDEARDELVTNSVARNLIGKRILELGCGSGDQTRLFYDASQVVGVDIMDKVSLERKGRFSFFLADAERLPFRNESFDAVMSFDVVEHILDDIQFVTETFRVCKKKGYVVVGTPNQLRLSNRLRSLLGKRIVYPCSLGPNTVHVREYTKERLASLCKNVGFVGECMCMWVGLVGRIDRGLTIFPNSIASLAQYLLFLGKKP